MRNTSQIEKERTARRLAYTIRQARRYLTQTRARVCRVCGHCFTPPPSENTRRCPRCSA